MLTIQAVIKAFDEESVDCKDGNGYTALHWCSATEQSERLVPALIALGATVDSVDKLGRYLSFDMRMTSSL